MPRLLVIVLLTTAGLAQTPAFEVASVKPVAPVDPTGPMQISATVDAARVVIVNYSLADLVRSAYRVKEYQIVGPSWLSAPPRFNVQAKIPEGVSQDLVPEMLQTLLAERFKLTIHRETREHPVYALVAGRNGPRLMEAEPEPESADPLPSDPSAMTFGLGRNPLRISGTLNSGGVVLSGGGQAGRVRVSRGPNGGLRVEAARITMTGFAETLAWFVDRPVVDQTGLKGNYQIALDLTIDAGRSTGGGDGARPAAANPAPPRDDLAPESGSIAMFQSVQALGLKLEPRKAPAEVIVIDHVEKMPTAN